MSVVLLHLSSNLLSPVTASYLFLGISAEKCVPVLLFILLGENDLEAALQ